MSGSEQSAVTGSAVEESDGKTSNRRRQRALLIVLPVAVVLALFVLVLATRDSASQRRASSALLGELAPAIMGTTTTGEHFDLDSWRGRWVLVNFFSSTCVPCIIEHPELVDFHEKHTETGDARLVSVVFDDSVTNIKRFFETHGGDWPVVADGATAAAVGYGVTGVPESYLVAPSGVVVWKQLGGVTAAGINEVIDQFSQAT